MFGRITSAARLTNEVVKNLPYLWPDISSYLVSHALHSFNIRLLKAPSHSCRRSMLTAMSFSQSMSEYRINNHTLKLEDSVVPALVIQSSVTYVENSSCYIVSLLL